MVKFTIEKKGCAGYSYKAGFVEAAKENDEIISLDGTKAFKRLSFIDTKVIIDSKSLLGFTNCTVDYKNDRLSSGFIFLNPNSTKSCGCGESFEFKSK